MSVYYSNQGRAEMHLQDETISRAVLFNQRLPCRAAQACVRVPFVVSAVVVARAR